MCMSDSEAWILVGVPKRCRGILSAFTNLGEPADSRRMGLGYPARSQRFEALHRERRSKRCLHR